MKVVIPAAGNGQRFKDAGYDKPKPLIDVAGEPMLQRVISNVTPPGAKVVVIAQHDHGLLPSDDYEVVQLTEPTQGAVETILKAPIEDEPLLIANCDQLCDFDVNQFVNTELDGALVTFKSNKPHHSYVAVDEEGIITDIKEKEVISSRAVSGVYYFAHGTDFVSASEKVIKDNIRTKGEFYVSTAIAELVRQGKRIGVYEAPTVILGTPEELQSFEVALRVGERVL